MLTGATIAYTLAEAGAVRVDVIDTAGRLVRILREAHDALGSHQLHWDGRDTGGRDVPGGVYFVRLRAGSTLSVQRLVRVR
jgi:flagellar hook assembly protein FlgD